MTITTKTIPTARALAEKFSEFLREDLGREKMLLVVERNRTAEYEGACASHDFCDANEVMLAALEDFGFDADDVFENDCDNPVQARWNEAWDEARQNEFWFKI